MRFKIRRTWFGVFALPLAVAAWAGDGTVEGKVVDTRGQPVAGAMVTAKQRGVPLAKAVQYVSTDQDGLFTIRRLDWGTYWVLAKKEEDGYPDTSFQFYSNGKELIVGLSPAIPSVNVSVVIGPKYAVVAGSIVDDSSGKPVNGTVHMWRRNAPDKPISIGGPSDFRVLVPPDEDIGFEVEVPDHETWTIPGGALHLTSGSTANPDVRVRPKASK